MHACVLCNRLSWRSYPRTPAPALHLLRTYNPDTVNGPCSVTPKTSAASFYKSGPVNWVCPNQIAHLYVEASGHINYEFRIEPQLVDTPLQEAMACK